MARHGTNPFGKILVQRGVLSAEALEQAVRLKERQGGSLAVNLVITGALDDKTLVGFYRERYNVAPISEEQLSRVNRTIFGLIPVEIIYDAGILPLWREGEEDEDRLVVGIIDPSEPEVLEEAAFFAALELSPRLLTIGQMARHYQRLTGKRWKVDWQTVLARRRIHQARIQAEASADEVLISLEDDVETRTEHINELLDQTQQLDASLDAIFSEKAGFIEEDFVIQFVSIDGERIHEEELVELTRVKKAVSSTLAGEGALEEAKRPRIAKKRKGENKRYLDPVEEGTASLQSEHSTPGTAPVELPSIIIDTALLSGEEAEAKLDALVNDPAFLDGIETLDPLPALASREIPEEEPEREELPLSFDDPVPTPPPEEPLPVINTEPEVSPEAPAEDWIEEADDAPEEDSSSSTDMAWFSGDIEERLGSLDAESSQAQEAPAAEAASEETQVTEVEPEDPTEAEPEAIPEPEIEVSLPERPPRSPDEDVVVSSSLQAPSEQGFNEERSPTLQLFSVKAAASQAPDEPSESLVVSQDASSSAESSSGLAAGLTFELTEADRAEPFPAPLHKAIEDLENTTERDQVGMSVSRFLRQHYSRVLLLSLRGHTASGWLRWITGDEPERADNETPITIESLLCLSRASEPNSCYLGPVAGSARSDATREALAVMKTLLGGDLPLSAVVCPVAIKGRIIAFIYCDEGPNEAVTVDRQSMAVLQHAVEESLLRVILLRKRRRR